MGEAETPQAQDRVAALVMFKSMPKEALLFNASQMQPAFTLSTDLNAVQQEGSGFASSPPLLKNGTQFAML